MISPVPDFAPPRPARLQILQLIQQARINIVHDLTRVSLKQAVDELMLSKRSANRREIYLRSLRHYLQRFTKGRESKLVCEIRVFEIELWLSQFHGSYSRQTWLNRISTLFSFTMRRGYIEANPCDRVERITIDRKPPFVLTPELAEKVLGMAHDSCRPYLILGLYAGVRPEELLHVTWDQVDLETRTLRLEHTKTRRRRIVPLEPKAVALLKTCPNKAGAIAPHNTTVRRFKRRVRRAMGWEQWPQDLLRHTAASYLLALIGDAGKVAMRLGNSAGILLTHYHQPVTKADCERFWKV